DLAAAATAHDFDRPSCRSHSLSVRTFDNVPGLQRVGKHRHAALFVKQNDAEDSGVFTQMVNQPLGVPDPPGAVTVFQCKLQCNGMRAQLVPQGAGQNLFALTQDEITAQRHHHAHGYGQMIMLEQRVQSLGDAINRAGGEQSGLITQVWIGEILFAQKKYQDAVDAFIRVFDTSPKGDKAAIALYKRAPALAEMGRRDEAVAQLNALVKAYPKRQESVMAKQVLQE